MLSRRVVTFEVHLGNTKYNIYKWESSITGTITKVESSERDSITHDRGSPHTSGCHVGLITPDFAHPKMIPGHPFKGGAGQQSTGHLAHPELKRFKLATAQAILPPRPDATPFYVAPAAVGYATADALIEASTGQTSVANTGNCEAYKSNL